MNNKTKTRGVVLQQITEARRNGQYVRSSSWGGKPDNRKNRKNIKNDIRRGIYD